MLGQYQHSANLMKLDEGLTQAFNDNPMLKDWYNIYFNIGTAKGAGLDWWGKRLNQGRELTYDGDSYYLEGAQTIDGVSYTAEEMENLYRQVLLMKAMSYISNLSMDSINKILSVIFAEQGRCYCEEVVDIQGGALVHAGTMNIRYVFEFYVSKIFKSIIESGLLPHPTGVGVSFEYLPLGEFLGFFVADESEQPYGMFDQNVFYR